MAEKEIIITEIHRFGDTYYVCKCPQPQNILQGTASFLPYIH